MDRYKFRKKHTDREVADIQREIEDKGVFVNKDGDIVINKDVHCRSLYVDGDSLYIGGVKINSPTPGDDSGYWKYAKDEKEVQFTAATVPDTHATTHESGGADEANHDDLAGFEADEHIDWTAAPTKNFANNGTLKSGDGGTTNYLNVAADGEVTLLGTARVLRDVWIPFNGMKAPGTKPATFVEHGISGAWSFADADDETIVFNIKFSNDMDKSVAPSIKIGWSTTTTVTSETATWQLEYLYTQVGEDTSAAAQATITVDSNAIAQAEGLIVATFPAMNTPNANDVCLHCRLKRLGAGGNDDLTDTAELHGLCMEYLSNKLGTAT